MIDDLLQGMDGAFAENTLKAYRSDFADFTAWCEAERLEPWGSAATDWARYIGDREPFLSAATLRRPIHYLNSLFRLANQKPHGNSPAVRLALKRMHRRKGQRQKQATPLTRTLLRTLLAQCGDDLRGRRNRVLLMTGYETTCSGSLILDTLLGDSLPPEKECSDANETNVYAGVQTRSSLPGIGSGLQRPGCLCPA